MTQRSRRHRVRGAATVLALVVVVFAPFVGNGPAAAATFSGTITLGCTGYTSTGDLGFTLDGGAGTEAAHVVAIDAAYADPLATPSVTLLDTTISGAVGSSAALGAGSWTTPPTHNPLFLQLADGNDSVIFSSWGTCDGLPWAQPMLGTPGGSSPVSGGSVTLVVSSCFGTTTDAALIDDGTVVSSGQTTNPLPAGAATVPKTHEITLAIPTSVVPGTSLTASVVCGTRAAPQSPAATTAIQVGGTPPTSTSTTTPVPTTTPAVTATVTFTG